MKSNLSKNGISILLIFFYFSIFSQTETENILKNNSLNLKLNCTALIDFASFPTFEFSIEKRFHNYFGIQGEFGVQLYSESPRNVDTIVVNTGGFRARLEGRFYASDRYRFKKGVNNKDKSGFFTGMSLLYRSNSYNANYDYFNIKTTNNPSLNTTLSIKDNIGVKKSVYGANLLFGGQFYISDRVFIEPTIYLGYIYRNISNIDRETPKQEDLKGKLMAKGYLDLEESSGSTLNISIAARIGMRIW